MKYANQKIVKEDVAKEYGYNVQKVKELVKEVGMIFATIAKNILPYKITRIEDGKEIEKQFEKV